MAKKVWYTNGTIEYQQLTAEYLEDALTLIDTCFFPYENVCSVMGISQSPEALKEIRDLTRTTAYDGVTVIAVDTSTNKVVGVAFNKIQDRDNPAFENFARVWKQPKAKAVVEFMAQFDNLCNLFEYCQIDCLFELMFLSTSPECKGRGIGKKLSEISLEIATSLANGINVKLPIGDSQLGLEPRPKIISSIFTSFITQKIGQQLGFQVAAEKDCDQLEFQEFDFSSISSKGTKKITLEFKKLTSV